MSTEPAAPNAGPPPAKPAQRVFLLVVDQSPELKTALRTLVHYHLGTNSLRTRRVMTDLQAMASQPRP